MYPRAKSNHGGCNLVDHVPRPACASPPRATTRTQVVLTLSNSSPPGSPSLSLDPRQRRCGEVDGLTYRYIRPYAHPSLLDLVMLTGPALSSPSSELHHSTSIIGSPPILPVLHHYRISNWGLLALTLGTTLCEGLPKPEREEGAVIEGKRGV